MRNLRDIVVAARTCMLATAFGVSIMMSILAGPVFGQEMHPHDVPNDPLVVDPSDPAMAPVLALFNAWRLRSDGKFIVERRALIEGLLRRSADARRLSEGSLAEMLASSQERLPVEGIEPAPLEERIAKLIGGLESSGIHNEELYLLQVRDPRYSMNLTIAKIRQAEADCAAVAKKGSPGFNACLIKRGVPEERQTIADLEPHLDQCGPAAASYKAAVEGQCKKDCKATGSAFDDACLVSLPISSGLPIDSKPVDLPAVFLPPDDARRAIAVIEIVEGDARQHICGGLLRPGKRVATARHCFSSYGAKTALKEGRAYVRQVSDVAGLGYKLIYKTIDPVSEPIMSATDGVVLDFEASDELLLPDIVFRDPRGRERAVILGHFQHFNRSRSADASAGFLSAAVPTWYQALRWSKPGLCHVLSSSSGCTPFQCQTTPGYSGSPIFSERQPLVVLGLVSAPIHPDARCGVVSDDTTMAFSGSRIPLLK
ncbi:hypothetical protein ACQQ2N_17470 [Dokdonella sp. MW10]|uniref:hypothetical protein n=1 Tax=Dokdonella sp. MW10 TaxID=2992926 RepID=UPI003F7F2060